jgi:DNA-directed RNA polymerase specialized sigma24 family protein
VLHERNLKDVHRYVLRWVPQREEAEDITAQVFAAAFASLPRFRGQCSPYLWLLGGATPAPRRRKSGRSETGSSMPASDKKSKIYRLRAEVSE